MSDPPPITSPPHRTCPSTKQIKESTRMRIVQRAMRTPRGHESPEMVPTAPSASGCSLPSR